MEGKKDSGTIPDSHPLSKICEWCRPGVLDEGSGVPSGLVWIGGLGWVGTVRTPTSLYPLSLLSVLYVLT